MFVPGDASGRITNTLGEDLNQDGDNTDPGEGDVVPNGFVDGGILVALSTTIFGGIGGYLLRVAKTLSVGARLRRYYGQVMTAPTRDLAAAVARIEARLDRVGLTGQESS